MKSKELQWVSRKVKLALIDPTPENYKIRTDIGRERLAQSLKQYGLAGNMVVNYHPKKRGRFILIDGNSRRERSLEKKEKMVWVSIPNRPLTPKEYKAMSAMFDFARAGEVDIDRIKSDLGSSKDFFDVWKLTVPEGALKNIGKKGKLVMPSEKKTKGKDEAGTTGTFMVNLFFTEKQNKAFRKQEEKLAKRWKTNNTTDTVFKAFMSI